MTYPHRTRTSYQQWSLPPFQGAVRALIIACIAVFVVQAGLAVLSPGHRAQPGLASDPGLADVFIHMFGCVPALVIHGWIWQPVTYLFLHADVMHLLTNMLVLWFFGSALEDDWGPRRFLRYYFLTGIGAGLLSVVVAIHSERPTIGASGAIYGVLLAFGMLHPNRNIYIWGVIPIKAKWFVLGAGLFSLYASWGSGGGNISHIAHLGGMLFGLIYLKRAWRVGELYREIRWRLRRRRFQVIDRKSGNGDPRWPHH